MLGQAKEDEEKADQGGAWGWCRDSAFPSSMDWIWALVGRSKSATAMRIVYKKFDDPTDTEGC